jgi:transposase
MIEKVMLGLDVAKLTFEACLLWPNGKREKNNFPNSQLGFRNLLRWLHGIEAAVIHACLEPTGVYSKALALFLSQSGITVSQVNSYAVQCHGRSKNFRSKTDRIDAYLLADYCLKENPPAWEPPSPVQEELRELQHRIACLDEHIRQEENRLETVQSRIVREDIEESLGRLIVRRKALEKAATSLVKQDDALSRNYAILNSILGIGEKSAVRLLGLVQFQNFQQGRQVGCFAGLTPREFESGTSIHKKTRISRIGSSELRAALYFPAMVAIQHNPQMREFAQRLKARNKPPKVVICAVMRKLLVLASALIRNQKMYDPGYQMPIST